MLLWLHSISCCTSHGSSSAVTGVTQVLHSIHVSSHLYKYLSEASLINWSWLATCYQIWTNFWSQISLICICFNYTWECRELISMDWLISDTVSKFTFINHHHHFVNIILTIIPRLSWISIISISIIIILWISSLTELPWSSRNSSSLALSSSSSSSSSPILLSIVSSVNQNKDIRFKILSTF